MQFTVIGYNRVVEPQKQATLEYGFLPSESFGGRPFGLTILLNYHDAVSLKLYTRNNHRRLPAWHHCIKCAVIPRCPARASAETV